MKLDLDRVRQDVAAADTQDLLDRVTAYREGMEPDAIALIEAELRRRGVTPDDIDAHADLCRDVLRGPDGVVLECRECARPAVCEEWRWVKLLYTLPLFPQRQAYCRVHRRTAGG
jgi:hypothetical protein